MKIIIQHHKIKREISGPFQILGSKQDLIALKQALEEKIESEGFSYGWIHVNERMPMAPTDDFEIIRSEKSVGNQEPIHWHAPAHVK